MLLRLLLLFTVVPLVELVLLLVVADYTSWQFTLGLVLLTGFLGAGLARWQGTNCLQRIHQETAEGQIPGDALLDGLMILIAGAVLITPGVLTDLVGFGLLTPPLRRRLKGWLRRRFADRMRMTHHFGPPGEPPRPPQAEETIIDVRIRDDDAS